MERIFKITLVLLIVSTACHSNKEKSGSDENEPGADGSATGQSIEIAITNEQFEQGKMKLGGPETMSFQQVVKANGYIVATPNGTVNISSFIPGKITNINISPGESIKKGRVLFTLEGTEIVLLQENYAEKYNQLLLLKNNYERSLSLSHEQILAGKDLLAAETEYKICLAKTEGLKARLKMINIDPLLVEGGSISSKVNIYSPVSGVVSALNKVVGEFAEPQEAIAQILDPAKMQLEISVFKQDISDLLPGQKVRFYDPDIQEKKYEATLSYIGKTIEVESRTVSCTASLNKSDRAGFINNSFVETEIITCLREALSLPVSALIEEDGRYYVLALINKNEDGMVFKKSSVRIGTIQGSLAEVLDQDISNVLIVGAYNLYGI